MKFLTSVLFVSSLIFASWDNVVDKSPGFNVLSSDGQGTTIEVNLNRSEIAGVIAIPDHSTPELQVLDPSEVDVELSNTGYWRDLYVTTVKVRPKGEDRTYKRVKIMVKHPGGFPPKVIEPELAKIYRRVIENYEFLPIIEGRTDEQGVRYLVFCPFVYDSAIQPLVDWHHKQGLQARVISKASFTAQEIKDSIQSEYNNHTPPKLKWVLLVGDLDQMPTYTNWGVPCSDVWFVDFDLNYYADCAVGRLSCDNTSDLTNQVNKTLKFEKDPELGLWLEKALLVANSSSVQTKRDIRDYNSYGFYTYLWDTLFGLYPEATNANLKGAIEEGRVIVNYCGQGSSTAWVNWSYNGESWTGADIGGLNNGDRTPVVFNIASYCGSINNSDCLSEIWLEKYPGGAVASWAASDPTYTVPNAALDKALFWALCDTLSHGTPYPTPIWDIGWVSVFADFYMVAYTGGGAVTNYKMYLWLGDPALEPWRGQPINPTVGYPAEIPPGPQNFTVTVKDESGQPIEGALVCLYKDPEVYEYAYTDANGEVTFYINPTYGTMLVTVSSCNILPFEGTCMVVPGVAEEGARIPSNVRLRSNIVKNEIVLDYSLPKGEELEVMLYDVCGREVLNREFTSRCRGSVIINANFLSAGIYYITLRGRTCSYDHQISVVR